MADAHKTELAQNYEMSICRAGLAIKNAMFSQFDLAGHGVFLYLVAFGRCARTYRREEGRNAALHPSPIHAASCRDCVTLPSLAG